jgi:hypothetical protein
MVWRIGAQFAAEAGVFLLVSTLKPAPTPPATYAMSFGGKQSFLISIYCRG